MSKAIKNKLIELAKRDFDALMIKTIDFDKYTIFPYLCAHAFTIEYVLYDECKDTYNEIFNYAFEYFKYLKATKERIGFIPTK